MENDYSPTSQNASFTRPNPVISDLSETKNNQKYLPVNDFQKETKKLDFFELPGDRTKKLSQPKENNCLALDVSKYQKDPLRKPNKNTSAKQTKIDQETIDQVIILNKKLDHGFSFILSFQSPQLSNEVSFFDRVINESRFWSGTGESVRDPEFLELSKRFQTSMSLLKKSDCFKFLKQFVLHSQEGDSVSTSKNKLSLMKKKCVFLKLFKNSNFFQKTLSTC